MIGIRKKTDSEAEKDITKQNQPVLVGFRSAYVFDVSQWVATAWSAVRLQVKSSNEDWSAAMYSACVEAFASGHDVLRSPLYLSSMSASSALPNDRLRAGPV